MRYQIPKPLHKATSISTNRDPFKYLLFSTRGARGFQTFQSELPVVWAKRSLLVNKIESKSYHSPLILHSARVLQKICVWIHNNKCFVETVLLSTQETLHIKKYTLYFIQKPMFHIFYSTYADASMYQGSSCRGFTLLLQLLKSKNSVFASSSNMSKLLLLLRWFLAKMRRLWNRQTVPYYFRCWWRPWRDVFPCGSTLSIHSPFWKSWHIWRYKDILSRKSSHKDTSISVIFWTFLLGKLINSVDPQGNTSSHQGLRQQQRK